MDDQEIIDTFSQLTRQNIGEWKQGNSPILGARVPRFDENRHLYASSPLGVLGAMREMMGNQKLTSSSIDKLWREVDEENFSVPVRRIMLVITDELIDPNRRVSGSSDYHAGIRNSGGSYVKDWRGVTFYHVKGEDEADYERAAGNLRQDGEDYVLHPWIMIWLHRGRHLNIHYSTRPYGGGPPIDWSTIPLAPRYSQSPHTAARLGIDQAQLVNLVSLLTHDDAHLREQGRELFEIFAQSQGLDWRTILDMEFMDVSSSKFIGSSFTDLDLSNIIWDDCVFVNCRFITCSLVNCFFDRASFLDCAFFRGDGASLSFKDAEMVNTTIQTMSLQDVPAMEGIMDTDFTGAAITFPSRSTGSGGWWGIYTDTLSSAGDQNEWYHIIEDAEAIKEEPAILHPKVMKLSFYGRKGTPLVAEAQALRQRTAGIIQIDAIDPRSIYSNVTKGRFEPMTGGRYYPEVILSSHSMSMAAAVPGMPLDIYFKSSLTMRSLPHSSSTNTAEDLYDLWFPNHDGADEGWMITEGSQEPTKSWVTKPFRGQGQETYHRKIKKWALDQFRWVLALNKMNPMIGAIMSEGEKEAFTTAERPMFAESWDQQDSQNPKSILTYYIIETSFGQALRIKWDARYRTGLSAPGDYLFVNDEYIDIQTYDYKEAANQAKAYHVWRLIYKEPMFGDGPKTWDEAAIWSTGLPHDSDGFSDKYVSHDGDLATLPEWEDIRDSLLESLDEQDDHWRESAEYDVSYDHPELEEDSEEFEDMVESKIDEQRIRWQDEYESYWQQWGRHHERG